MLIYGYIIVNINMVTLTLIYGYTIVNLWLR